MFSLSRIASPKQSTGEVSAYLLGHAYGVNGWKPRLPASFSPDECQAFEDGWRAGDASRGRSSPVPTPNDEERDYLADRYAGDPGDDACPDFLAAFTMSNDDYYQAMADATEEADPWTLEEWDRKVRSAKTREIHQVERERMGHQ